MTLRPEIEALVQGAIDGSLSPDDHKTLDDLMASDHSVRARAAELEQLSALLQSVRQVDAPPTFAADVLARIHASSESPDRVVEFSRGSKPGKDSALRGGVSMNKNIIWGLAAAAVLVLAAVGYMANPSVNQGTEATIGAAQRYQAPQIEAKDVAVGDTKTIALMQTATWDAIVKDETLRTLLQDANFRTKLQDPEIRRALQNPEAAKKLSDVQLQVALARPAFQAALRDQGFVRAIRDPRFGEALIGSGCGYWLCGGNSPIVAGAVIK